MENTIQSLDNSFKYFDALYKNTVENCILLLDEKGIILSVNNAFTNCFGYEQNDIVGKYISIIFTEEDIENGKPEKEILKVLSGGQASDDNYLVLKDKNITWVSGESILVKNDSGDIRILKVIQDINQQKKSEDQVTQLGELNEKILKTIGDAVIVLDQKLNILNANETFNALFRSNVPGKRLRNFDEIIEPFDVSGALVKHIQNTCISKKGFSNFAIELDAGSNERRIYDVSCNVMEHDKNELKLLLVIHDITAHRQLEREREDVIGFVAHELRNPLANLVLCNELLGDLIKENDMDAIDDILKRSKNNVLRLNKLIGELYDAAKINSGNFKLDISTFNFEEMIKEAIETIEGLHSSYNIVVTGGGNIDVKGDRYRLIQVVTNYLSNGIKYSDGSRDVFLNISYDNDNIIVSVKDNGLGISPKQLPYIFDRFFRAEKTKNLEGIGLGLFLCRQIIGAHRGKVWAESEEGRGSTFYFSIPRR